MNTESMMQKFLLRQISLKDHLGSWDIGILKAGMRVWLRWIVSLSGKVSHNQQLPCKKTVMATWENKDNIFLVWGLETSDILIMLVRRWSSWLTTKENCTENLQGQTLEPTDPIVSFPLGGWWSGSCLKLNTKLSWGGKHANGGFSYMSDMISLFCSLLLQ